MSVIQSNYAKGIIALAYPSIAGAATAVRFAHQLSAAPSAGDILELAMIPAGTRVVEMILDSDDLDTNGTPTLTMDVGLMSGSFGDEDQARTCGAEFFSGSSVAQAGGSERPSLKTAFRTGKSNVDRSIGIKFPNAAATFAAGTIGLTVIVSTE
ncbi:hypothetical protein [Sinorhizobium chiapasense]|uniref:Uncharacterized protein n=1 Tax=Sinorhizobium chiapasense TaxID=501572 RepID=A0ABZ2BES4_9HYPH